MQGGNVDSQRIVSLVPFITAWVWDRLIRTALSSMKWWQISPGAEQMAMTSASRRVRYWYKSKEKGADFDVVDSRFGISSGGKTKRMGNWNKQKNMWLT